MTTRKNERDVICLSWPAEFLHICLYGTQKVTYRKPRVALNNANEALFPIFVIVFIGCFGYAVAVNNQNVPREQSGFLNVAWPIEKQSQHSRCTRQALYGSVGV